MERGRKKRETGGDRERENKERKSDCDGSVYSRIES
jgi:hypothetical protein